MAVGRVLNEVLVRGYVVDPPPAAQKPTCFHHYGHTDSSVASFDTVMSSVTTSASTFASTFAAAASASAVSAPIFPAVVVLTAVMSSDSTATTAASFSAGLVLLVTPTLFAVPATVSNVGRSLDVFLQRHPELTARGGEMGAGVKLACRPRRRVLCHDAGNP